MSDLGIDVGELRIVVREMLDEHHAAVGDQVPGEDGRPLDRPLWEKMAELGWLALSISEEHGGLGLGHAHLAVLYEELGRHLATVPVLTTLLAAEAIGAAGSAGQKSRWLPTIAAGQAMATLRLPDDAGPVPALDGGNRISATFEHVPFADAADLLLLPVMDQDGAVAFALIEPRREGVLISRRPIVDLTRSMGVVTLQDVALTADDLVRVPEAVLEQLRNHACMATACDSVGGAAAILELTIEYMGVRQQFGRPIGSFQALKHRAANWKVLLEATIALARHCADALAAGEEESSALASSAKFYASDVYAALAGDAVQLHGGIGFTWEHVCHLFLKRAKLNQQIFGSASLHKDRVARLAFGTAE